MNFGQPSRFDSGDTDVDRARRLNDTMASIWRIFQELAPVEVVAAVAASVYGHTSQMPDPNALNRDHDRRYYPQYLVRKLIAANYAGVSVVSNSTATVIVTAGVKVQFVEFDTNDPSDGSTPDHTNDHITISEDGDYLVVVSITLESVAGVGSVCEIEVKKNNGVSDVGALHVDRDIGGGGAESGSMGMSGIAMLAEGDTIEIWVENETNTQNYILEDVTLSVVKLD